jgi:hypothetical protein
MTGPVIVFRFTRGQQMALANIVLNYAMMKDQPQEFVDVVNDQTTTTAELLRLVTDPREWEQTKGLGTRDLGTKTT